LELPQLEQFIMIEKSKSMRLAAEKLFLSQPTLSHNLKKLERELGCRLFDRTRNQLLLNNYGKILLEHAKCIMQEIEMAKKEISEEKIRQVAKINIGCHSYAFWSFMMPQLANSLKQHIFECRKNNSARLEEELRSGALDIIFTDSVSQDSSLKKIWIFNEQIMVSLPSSSEFSDRPCLYIPDLPKLNLYLVSDALGYTEWYYKILDAAGIDAAPIGGVPFSEYLYTKDNVDKCHMTTSFIMRFVPTVARRVVIPLADGIACRDIYMVYKSIDEFRLEPIISYIEQNKELLFNNSSFLPYFLFPGETSNLITLDNENDIKE
jgi:DNA-binding transcriptional LysR family regulator